ncbi:MAG TPA: CPBP family glutamic-type intramembrane protease [Roseiflexaceae bacterium]|nr:CPBP family glutamic-type intramembrane protease [Roseiflexaceae bacterium]
MSFRLPAPPRASLVLWGYLLLITLAEVLTAAISPHVGLTLHALLLVGLVLHGALAREVPWRNMVLALTLAPLIRLLSLSLPLTRLPQIAWYPIVSAPLLLAAWVVIRQIGVARRELGLTLGNLPLQLVLTGAGLALGAVEYAILQPKALFATFSWGAFLVAALILLVATGFTEELLFRGLLQTVARPALGRQAIVYVSLLFAVLHVGYLSLVDVVFVFAVGWAFGFIVRMGGSILGVTLAHGLTNIMLFLVMPHVASDPTFPLRPWMVWAGVEIWVIAAGVLLLHSWARRPLDAPQAPQGAAIRAARRGAGITYTELAQRCGLSVRLLAEIEHGLAPLEAEHVRRIAAGLGVAPGALAPTAA